MYDFGHRYLVPDGRLVEWFRHKSNKTQVINEIESRNAYFACHEDLKVLKEQGWRNDIRSSEVPSNYLFY